MNRVTPEADRAAAEEMRARETRASLRALRPLSSSSFEAHAQGEGGLQTSDIIAFFRSNLPLIVGTMLLCMALGLAYAMLAKPRYTAQASLVIDNTQEQFSSLDGATRVGPQDVAAVETQIQILRSQRVALAVVRELNLPAHPEFAAAEPEAAPGALTRLRRWLTGLLSADDGGGAPGGPPLVKPSVEEVAAYKVRENMDVRRVGAAHVIEVSATAGNPNLAWSIANALTEAYIADQRSARYDAVEDASAWMEARIAKLRDQLNAAARQAQVFRAQNNLVKVSENGTLLIEHQLTQLNVRLAEAQSEMAAAIARLRTVQGALERDPAQFDIETGEAGTNMLLTQLREHYVAAVNRAVEAESRYGSDHSAVRATREELERLRSALRSELRRVALSLQTNSQAAQDRVRQLRDELDRLVASAKEIDEARVQLQQLETIAESYKATYESYLQRYNQTIQQQSAPILNARVISPALPPTGPSAPRKGLILALAAVFGGALGVAIALALRTVDRSVRVPEDLAETGVPCLAVLPDISEGIGFGNRLLRRLRANPMGQLEAMRHVSVKPLSPFTAALHRVKTSVRMAFRPRPQAGAVIGIVSARPDEGKSVVASNLAQIFALGGARVLLIDGDMHKAAISAALAMAGGRRSLRNVRVMELTKTLGASAQSQSVDPSDLLGSPRMEEALRQLRPLYDYVIVDLPPTAAVPDALAIAPFLDGFIMVCEWGRTDRKTIEDTFVQLAAHEGQVIGYVLNKADMGVMRRLGHPFVTGYQQASPLAPRSGGEDWAEEEAAGAAAGEQTSPKAPASSTAAAAASG